MAYIGSTPTSGDFVLLDSITTSATASYTMQKNSVNFEPQSANHMIVSLNGTIQAPVSSFTVSGSTLTFASALTSSDVIDFVLVLGSVNDVAVATTVVDSAITKNKTDFITDGSSAGVTVKGSGSDSGSIALNCSSNSHAIQLISPDHSAGQSYKLKLPDNNVTADKFIKVKSITGSGATATGQLEFADASGGVTLVNSSAATTGDSLLALSSVFSSTYEVYVIDVLGYQPSAAGYLLSQLATSSGYLGSAINYFSGLGKQDENSEVDNHVAGSGQTAIYLHPTTTKSDDHLNMKINLYLPTGVGTYKPKMFYTGVYIQDSGSKSTAFFGQTSVDTTSTITGMKFYPSTGTINDLQVKVYGFQKAT